MKFGICGYGNLAKEAERLILNSDDELVCIFSRRKNISSNYSTPIYPYEKMHEFAGKIDVMLMCSGSEKDLPYQSPEALKYFNIIDTFDTHSNILAHKKALEKVSKVSHKTAIYSCGWDPGIFSMIRVLFNNILGFSETFWGKGVSQGHSEALRNVDGVQDAIEYTIPNQETIKKVRQNPEYKPSENEKHKRLCYVCLNGTRSQDEVTCNILNIENYFKGQDVTINYVSQKEIDKKKKHMSHKGIIISSDNDNQVEFRVKMKSNPAFTTKILLAYAHAIEKLSEGVYSALDVPLNLIGTKNNADFI